MEKNITVFTKTLIKDDIDVENKQKINKLLIKLLSNNIKTIQKEIKDIKNYINSYNNQAKQQKSTGNKKPTNKNNSSWERILLLVKQLYLPLSTVVNYENLNEIQLQQKETELKVALTNRDNLMKQIEILANQLGIKMSMFLTMMIEELEIAKRQLEQTLLIIQTKEKEEKKQKQENNRINSINNFGTNIEKNSISNNIKSNYNVKTVIENKENYKAIQKLFDNIKTDIKTEPKSILTSMTKSQNNLALQVKMENKLSNSYETLTKTSIENATENKTSEKNLIQTLMETGIKTITTTITETLNKTQTMVKNIVSPINKTETKTKVENEQLTTNKQLTKNCNKSYVENISLLGTSKDKIEDDADIWTIIPTLSDRTTKTWDKNYDFALRLLYEKFNPIDQFKIIHIKDIDTPVDDIPYWPSKLVDKEKGREIWHKAHISRDGKVIPVYGVIKLTFDIPELMKTADIFKKANKMYQRTGEEPHKIMSQNTYVSTITDIIEKPTKETIVVNRLSINQKIEKNKNISKENSNEKTKSVDTILHLNRDGLRAKKSTLVMMAKNSNNQEKIDNLPKINVNVNNKENYKLNFKVIGKTNNLAKNNQSLKATKNKQQTYSTLLKGSRVISDVNKGMTVKNKVITDKGRSQSRQLGM